MKTAALRWSVPVRDVQRVALALADATRGPGMKREDRSALGDALGVAHSYMVWTAVSKLLALLPLGPSRVAVEAALNVNVNEAFDAARLEDRRQRSLRTNNVSYRTLIAQERKAQLDMAVIWSYAADFENHADDDGWIDRNWQEGINRIARNGLLWVDERGLVFKPTWLTLPK